MADDLRHGVAADVGVLEHEGVARVIAEGLHAPDQPVVDHARVAVLQLAHALVEQRDQVLDAVGHRRVSGEADIARIAAPGERTCRRRAVLQIGGLRQRNDFRQDLDLFVDAGPAAEKYVDRFLEIEQPERQAQIARRQHLRLFAEAAAIFVVRVDEEDAQVRPGAENLLQDDGDAARFADAGRAEDGEVPAHQLVDIDADGDVRVLLEVADMGAVFVGRTVDHAQLALGQELRAVADIGIFGDAALEAAGAVVGADLADQIEPRHPAESRSAARSAHGLLGDLGDHADGDAFPRHQAHVLADGRVVGVRARVELDRRLRAGHRRNAPDQVALRRSMSVLCRCKVHKLSLSQSFLGGQALWRRLTSVSWTGRCSINAADMAVRAWLYA